MRLQETPETADQLISERLVGIDILRGFAVLFVVLNHTPHYAMGGFRENPFFIPAMMMDYGYLGVPLFVLISGFCIHRRASIAEMKNGRAKLNWLDFWKRRFWRLYPPYVVAMILSVAAAVWFHDKSPRIMDTLTWDATTHLLLIHNLTADYAGGMANGAFWSLGMEEQLYLLYFPMFMLIRRSRRGTALAIAACVTIAWRAISLAACTIDTHAILPEQIYGLGTWGLWPFSFWLHWTLGAISVDAYFGNCRLPKWCTSLAAATIIAGIGLVTNRVFFDFLCHTRLEPSLGVLAVWVPRFSNISELWFAVAFFCLLNWCVAAHPNHRLLKNPASMLLARLGKISYSVYLVHIPVIFSLETIVPFGHSPAEWLARLLLYVGSSLLISVLFYSAVEQWFLAGRCPWIGRRNVEHPTPTSAESEIVRQP